jgi:ABC-type uncharacterized transport system involved in gliding motility auxiliary subunit
MNISQEVKLINPRVKDHRGYTDMIFDLTVFIDVTDLDTNCTIGYQLYHKFDTEIEYSEQNPFVSFEEVTEQQVNSLVNTLIEEERVFGQLTLNEWAEKRFNEIYAEPKQKPFSFQLNPNQ